MSGIIYKTGAVAILQEMRLDVYSNNLANLNTVGYKADKTAFQFDEPEVLSNIDSESTPQLSPYAPAFISYTDYTPGAIQNTGNPLDVAIVGKGFFEVQTAEGFQYSRSGRFSVNEDGVLSTSDGWPVMGQGGEIVIDGGSVKITDGGEVSVDGEVVDVLRVVDFPEPYNLKKVGNSAFVPELESIIAQDAPNFRVTQGAVEASNANAIGTMTKMIELLRTFESYQKVIKAADETMARTINDVGSTT